MNLTTVSDVKLLLGAEKDIIDDTINLLIPDVSAEIEAYLDRTVLIGNYTEVLDVLDNQARFILNAYPIVTVTSVKYDSSRAFGSTTVIASTNYFVNNQSGIITVDKTTLTSGVGVLQVVYSGGMSADTNTFKSAWRAVYSAATTEVAYRYKNRANLGILNVSASGANISLVTKKQFLPQVEDALDPYRRVIG